MTLPKITKITATPHNAGNRIDLMWFNPQPHQYPGVRVVRRKDTHPASPDDGVVVAEVMVSVVDGKLSAVNVLEGEVECTVNEDGAVRHHTFDKELKGGEVYYYTFFPYDGDPPDYQFDGRNRASVMATSSYNMARQMYDLLPLIYHRYDTVLPKEPPPGMPEVDWKKGQLRRFLDITGGEIDRFYSFARSAMDLHDIDRVEGSLLPLLAKWIGWKTDYTREIESQRSEVRGAPAVFKTIGLIPTVEATVQRISGWESRTKEFAHNVFTSNRPERLNLWVRYRGATGGWSVPEEPLSLDFAYEGRPAAVRDGDGTQWFFYHAVRNGGMDIRYKKLVTFKIDLGLQSDLNRSAVTPAIRQAFESAGHPLSRFAGIEKKDGLWLITDKYGEDRFTVRKEGAVLNVYMWIPSQPFNHGGETDKYPSAVFHDGVLRVFWSEYSETDKLWRIKCRNFSGGKWSDDPPFGDDGIGRKRQFAVVDNSGGLWLFWLELEGKRWLMKYKRRHGGTWGSKISFPPDGTVEPRVEDDPFVLFHPGGALWVFWARMDTVAGRRRRGLICRIKNNLNPDNTGWSGIISLSLAARDYHEREPAAIVRTDGDIDLYWSSTKYGSWSVCKRKLTVATHSPGPMSRVASSPYSHRDPLPLNVNGVKLLIYRSNESLTYRSKVYKATETVDFRYAGSTTVHTRDAGKIALRGKFEDFQTYTYDTGKTNDDWYSRNTIGLYLKTDTVDEGELNSRISRIDKVLAEFMPSTDRAVYIRTPHIHEERIYSYGQPLTERSMFISTSHKDDFVPVVDEEVAVPEDDFSDEIS